MNATKDWRVVLQLEDPGAGSSCTGYALSGVAFPARISVVACDATAVPDATATHAEIDRALRAMGAAPDPCTGPRDMGCLTWKEPSCQHVLVLVVGSAPLDPAYEQLADDWIKRGPGRVVVLTALRQPLVHAQVFPSGSYPHLERRTASAWGGSALRLAQSALAAALLDERPGVFISYLRKEASSGAEAVHNALTKVGFRVFLDRFSGTPGRVFPHELSEAMATMGLVVLLETGKLFKSRWTMWEATFARRYRLGPIAVNFMGARQLPWAIARHTTSADPATPIARAEVDAIVEFIRDRFLAVAVSRRAYYETLVRAAAQSKGGLASPVGAGILAVETNAGVRTGRVLPGGMPGRLRHVRRLVEGRGSEQCVLAGEHQHLAPSDRADLRWLAGQSSVILTGSASVYRTVRGLL